MRRLLASILALVLALPILSSAAEVTSVAPLMIRYDVDAATTTYCRSVGIGGNPFGSNLPVPGAVTTSGSSTTVTSVGSAGSFAGMGVGDVLFVNRGGGGPPVIDTAVIVTYTNANTVVVDAAVNWSNGGLGYTATWRDTQCGTTVNDGWVDVTNAIRITMSVDYIQGDLTAGGLEVVWECKSSAPGAVPRRVWPSSTTASCGIGGTYASGFCDFATAGTFSGLSVEEFGAWAACRIGTRRAAADTSDAGANIEQVNADIIVAK